MSIASYFEQTNKSNRSLAQLVHEALRARQPPVDELLDPTSIAPKIGELQSGKTTWWAKPQKRPYLEALASLLNCAPEALVAVDGRAVSSNSFVDFVELPQNAVFNPAPLYSGQTLCDHIRHQLNSNASTWMVVAQGGGKSHALTQLSESNDTRVVKVRTLVEARARLEPGHRIVIELLMPDGLTDPAMEVLFAKQMNLCVLAEFDPPPRLVHSFAVVRPSLSPDWKQRLLLWVNLQLRVEKQINTEAFFEWYSLFDPTGDRANSPGEMLTLLASCARFGIPNSSTRMIERARAMVALRLASAAGISPWLTRFGADAFELMIRNRLASVMPREPLTSDQWGALIPKHLCPMPDITQLTKLFAALPKANRKSARAELQQKSEVLIGTATPASAIEALRAVGLLGLRGMCSFEPSPAWVRDVFEDECIDELLRHQSVEPWGTAAADESRTAIVDAALDRLSPPKLMRLVGQVLDATTTVLPGMAAMEAIFEAVGRRMQTGWAPEKKEVPNLQRLGILQWKSLVDPKFVPSFYPMLPVTRRMPVHERSSVGFVDHAQYCPGSVSFGRQGPCTCAHSAVASAQIGANDAPRDERVRFARWLAAAWAFTIGVPKPAGCERSFDWRFAGWIEVLAFSDFEETTHNIPWPHMANISNDGGAGLSASDSAVYLPLANLAAELLERISSFGDDRVSAVFWPAVLQSIERRGWAPTARHISRVADSGCFDILFELWPIEHDGWVFLAPWLWSQWNELTGKGKPSLVKIFSHDRRLASVFARHLSVSELLEGCNEFTSKPVHAQQQCLALLRATRGNEVVTTVVEALLAMSINAPPSAFASVTVLLQHAGDVSVDSLVKCVSDRFGLGVLAAARVWEIDESRALRELRWAVADPNSTTSYAWLSGALPEQWEVVLPLVEGAPPSSAVLRWSIDRVPRGGPYAARLFEIWQRVSSSITQTASAD